MPHDTFSLRSTMPASADEVYAWHARPLAFQRLQPPWEPAEVVAKEGRFGDALRVTLRAPLVGPVRTTMVSEAFGFEPGRGFRDRLTSGPFAHWEHVHTMTPDGPDQCALEDRVEYRLPLGAAGRLFGGAMVRGRLARMFAYRHALTASDLRRTRGHPPLRVAVTGSRGLVGSELVPFLSVAGHDVVRLVRGEPKPAAWDDGTASVAWNPDEPVDEKSLEGVQAVVHLAGEGIADGRWTAARKKRILDSRTGPTRRLAEALARLDPRPRVLVSASAVGVYGDRGDELLDESAAPGTGFLADVCRAWEEATRPAEDAGVRVVRLRIGVVQTPRGAGLGKQLAAFRAGGGATLGDGRQWVSWVTMNDLIGAIHHAIVTDSLAGPVNAVAPSPVTNREYGRVLARVLGRPYLLTLPAAALRVMFGEVADAALLASMRAAPAKLLGSGFAFDHPTLEPALRFLLGRSGG